MWRHASIAPRRQMPLGEAVLPSAGRRDLAGRQDRAGRADRLNGSGMIHPGRWRG